MARCVSLFASTILIASFAALAQTTAGSSARIVFPVTAQTISFSSEMTVYNPNASSITVNVSFYNADNVVPPGLQTCGPLVVPAGMSVQFSLVGQCALPSGSNGSNFGLLILTEQTGTQRFQGYARTQTPGGIGFATEGFPIENFNDELQHVTGLKRSEATGSLPPLQTNCFVGTLDDAVDYELRLFDDMTNAQIGATLAGSAPYVTIAGGAMNTASDVDAVIGGGTVNAATGLATVVAGGTDNIASGLFATVGGGAHNRASGFGSVVAGGRQNAATGGFATVAGGFNSVASGDRSFASGFMAKASARGAFVWANAQPFEYETVVENAFAVRATGGVGFTVGIDANGATTWSCALVNGVSGWQCTSDRDAKENFRHVNGREVLERLAAMPLFTWNAKGVDSRDRHLGPMAQDFHAASNLGRDDRMIASGDADGVALAAIQGLHELMATRIDAQQREIEAQRGELAALNERLARLEKRKAAPRGRSPMHVHQARDGVCVTPAVRRPD
jgi:hypothetical protein